VSEREFDVVVIGMGPGGEYVATKLAAAGVAVAAVEENLVGGECRYWGCDPSKMMIRAGNLLAEGRRIPGMAGASVISPDLAQVACRIRDEATHDWNDKVAADRFTGLGGTLYRGHGTIGGPATVRVGDSVLKARRGIVIGTGTAPWIPPVDGLAGTPYWTNRQAVEAEQVPRSLIVLGGGPAGVEFAQVFARFGATVTIIEELGRLLPEEEPESSELVTKIFRSEGMTVHTGASAQSVSHDGSAFTVALAGGPQLTGERLLVATGRKAGLASIGVGAIGQGEHVGYLEVDDNMRAAPGVWALGDVVGKGAHTHMSLYHGRIILSQRLGRRPRGAAGHLHRSGDRRGRADRGAGPGTSRRQGQHRHPPDPAITARPDTQGRQWRVHQAGRRQRTRHPGRRHLSRAVRRGGTEHAHPRGARRGTGAAAAGDDLCLPDLPRRHPGSDRQAHLMPRPAMTVGSRHTRLLILSHPLATLEP
jgi:pyruvate/2-oxoglutarate dehydrogenase complex dihydrolipoamide dehydrogenase (E3) component